MQSEGKPSWVKSDSDAQQYCDDVFKTTGIRIEPDNLVKNPNLRAFSKSLVVSSWAKVLEHNLKRQVAYCHTYAELMQILTNSKFNIVECCFVADDVCMIIYEYTEESVNYESNTQVNTVLGAFTLSKARLVLYSYLELIPEGNVLYYDCDGFIFKSNPEIDAKLQPYIGTSIGQIKSELPEGYTALAVAITSPKSYALKMVNENNEYLTIQKVKGFVLNAAGRDKLSFDSFKDLLLNNPGSKIVVDNQPIMKRNVKTGDIRSEYITKRLRLIMDKRVFLPNSTLTVPYGYNGDFGE